MIELRRLVSKICMRVVLLLFWVFPIRDNKIVLLNGCNFKYSDSPKSVAEYLRHNGKNVSVYFAVGKNTPIDSVEGVKFIHVNSVQYFYHVCTCKVFLTNDGGISYIPFRKKQFVINTWHGGGAYKPIGRSLNKSKLYEIDLKMTSKNTDLFLSSCERFTGVVSDALLISKDKFWEIGLPRNDYLINATENEISRVKKSIGVENKKILLYAPTFRRDNVSLGENLDLNFEIDIDETLKALQDKFHDDWIIGIRKHPGIKSKKTYDAENTIDLSAYPDMQELLLAADILVTDYSSCSWDFMLTKKPIFIYAPDLDDYVKKCELYTPISEWPYPIARNMKELSSAIDKFEYSEYLSKCEEHCRQLGIKESGKATQLLGERIINMLQ